jgi:hypothetical protein
MNKEFTMNIGMLWFDNDPRTALTVKVARAADYYRQKYGLVADLCLVHPSMLVESRPGPVEDQVEKAAGTGAGTVAGTVAVRPNRVIQPGHLWIGTEEKN